MSYSYIKLGISTKKKIGRNAESKLPILRISFATGISPEILSSTKCQGFADHGIRWDDQIRTTCRWSIPATKGSIHPFIVLYVCVYTCIYIYILRCICNLSIYIYIHTYTHIHIITYTYIYIYIDSIQDRSGDTVQFQKEAEAHPSDESPRWVSTVPSVPAKWRISGRTPWVPRQFCLEELDGS